MGACSLADRLSEAQFLAMVNASLYDNCSQVDGA
jgi:hypothetical protein